MVTQQKKDIQSHYKAKVTPKLENPEQIISDSETNLRQTAEIAGGIVFSELAKWNLKEAAHYKTLSILYLIGALAFLFVMIAFAYALFIYDASLFIWKDGSTMWGVIMAKSAIFIPLIILTWFFVHEFLYAKDRYEIYMHRASIFQIMEKIIDTENKADFIKEILSFFGEGISTVNKEKIEAKIMLFAVQYLTKIPVIKDILTNVLASSLQKK